MEQVNTICFLSIYMDPFGKKDGNFYHAAVGKPGFHGISRCLVCTFEQYFSHIRTTGR